MLCVTQSSHFSLPFAKAYELVRHAPLMVKSSGAPVIHYQAPLGIWDGAPVHYRMLQGMVVFAWSGFVTHCSAASFRVKIAPAHKGPFTDFTAAHQFEEDGQSCVVVHDQFDVNASDPQFEQTFSQASCYYGFEGRSWAALSETERQTTLLSTLPQSNAAG